MSARSRADAAARETETVELEVPGGLARVHVRRPDHDAHDADDGEPSGCLVLGHGAGGGFGSVDLTAAAGAAFAAGWTVALVEQPWLVAGRRIAVRPPSLDAAFVPVVRALRGPGGALDTVSGPLVLGGRSAGARVACRTAVTLDAAGVLLLSFPLYPPGRPDKSRAPELALVLDAGLPVAVVQGERDPMGTPEELAAHLRPTPGGFPQLHAVPGTHTIARSAAAQVAAAVTRALTTPPLRPPPPPPPLPPPPPG